MTSTTSWPPPKHLSPHGRRATPAKPTAAPPQGALGGHLEAHLDDEERELLPLCAQHLSAQEWGALAGHAMANFAGDKVWLILGLVAERMTQSQRDDLFAHLPPAAMGMWTQFGERAFSELMAAMGPPLLRVGWQQDNAATGQGASCST